MPRLAAALVLLLCALLWGMAFIAQKAAMQHMGPLTFSFIRYFIGSALMAPLALREYRRRRAAGVVVTANQWWRIGWLSLAFFIGVWLQQTALRTTTATNGGFITSLYVVFTPLVAYALSRVKPHPIIYLGVPLATFGTYLLTGADLSRLSSGEGLLFLCAIAWAVQVAMLGDLVRETGMPVTVSVINFFFTAVCATIGAYVFEVPSLPGILDGWLPILYSGIFSSGIAFTLQAVGQQYVPPSNAAIILSSESLFAALGGALFLGERLPPIGYAGAAIIFVTIIVVELVPALQKKPLISSLPGSV